MTDTVDPSNDQPIEPETFDRGDPQRRCTAGRSDGSGERCRNWAIRGGNVCRYHGGAAKRTVDKARRRIAESADRGAKQLLKLAFDEKQSADIRLKATLQLLDRAGVNAKTTVDVEVGLRPFEQVEQSMFTQLEIGSRAAFRRSVGDDTDDADPPALADLTAAGFDQTTDDDDSIVAEVITEGEYGARMATWSNVNDDGYTMTPSYREHAPDDRTRPEAGTSDDHAARLAGIHPPVDSDHAMTVTDANDVVAEINARNAEQRRADVLAAREAGRAVIRQSQRALPRGRS